ncbi:glucuronide transporter [Agromyces mangrovi Wang et al. 2018]|uniref:glucuronide transporter n=1 Tax=Agromyces mangrovi TaxID=1858653 RepID=UPI0025735100|nr:glucuronide transporter [Agromyces mangrovi]BDZ64009.1 glucuronide transporter [Agromyces mangrovi]
MTTTDRDASPKTTGLPKLPKISYVGYGAGDMANNLSFTLASMFLLVYYTDVAGLSAAAVGTLFLVLRIFDAFTDIIAGRIVDKTYTKRWGKFRPYILFGSVPLLLLSIATFHVPQIGETGMLLYAYITYGLLGIAYTLVNIPYGSLAAAMTQVPAERARLATFRTMGAAVVGALLGIVVSPLLSPENDLQRIFTIVTVTALFVGMALYLFTFFTTKERVYRAVPKVTMKQSFATLKGNRPLLMLCISSLLLLSGMISSTTAQIYLMRDVFDALYLVPVLSLAQLALIFVIAPFVPMVVRRFGKRTAYIAGAVVGSLGQLITFFAPNEWVALGGSMIGLPGIMFVSMLIWALEADTVEYGEWKTGVRTEGITYAVFSFTRKAGQAVGGALAAYAIGFGGYAVGEQVVGTAAEWGIRTGAALIPAVLVFLAGAIMVFYPLTDKFHAQIVEEITAHRDDEAEVAGHGGIVDISAEEHPDGLTKPASDVSLSTAALRTGRARPTRFGRRRK